MKRTWEVNQMIGTLLNDPWRLNERPFSEDIQRCHAVLFDAGRPRREKGDALADWLAVSQPCLFGQSEAKQRRLAFCLLTENDLEASDQDIRQRIEQARVDWKRLGTAGRSHGFLIVAVSPTIALARPSPELHGLALKLCELYLGEAASDMILHDTLILEIDGGADKRSERRSWKVGVNYFSAQGDGRWWHDHRIPGGIAFSMNSVGHMARTLAERERVKDPDRARHFDEVPREKLVYWALPKAMKTIGPPHPGSSRGTWLAPHGSFEEDKEPPNFEQRERYFGDLASFSPNRYQGLYHTDHTVPTPYFDEALWKREDLKVRDDLYFTYLHDLDDQDYQSMGLGVELIPKDGGIQTINQDREGR
jgi:hypothetical protein